MTGVAAPVVVQVWPVKVPAASLPTVGMVHEVAQVLRAYGVEPDLLRLSSALYAAVNATSGGGELLT